MEKNLSAKPASDTPPIEKSKLPSRINEESNVSRGEVSRDSSFSIREAISDSLNYADNCMSEMITRIEEVGADDNASSIEKLQNITIGARNFAEVLRAKSEAIKLLIDSENHR